LREIFLVVIGTAGGVIVSALGGWDLALQTLLIFMLIDYAAGLIAAGVFKKSKKSANGALESHAGFKGIIKKCMIMLFVIMGHQLDNVIGWDFVRYAVIIAFLANEAISIIENAGLMGVYIPPVLRQAIDILRKKEDADAEDDKKTKP